MEEMISKSTSKKKERWSLMGTPPMQEPRLMEWGKLRMETDVDRVSSIVAVIFDVLALLDVSLGLSLSDS